MSRVLSNEVTLLNIAGIDNDIKDAFTREMLAQEEPLDVSTKKYRSNQFFIWKDRKYYKTLANIEISERFVLGTNIKEMTIGEVLTELYQVNPAVAMHLIGYEEEEEFPIANPYVVGQYIVRQGNLWRVIQNVNLTTPWQPGVNIEMVDNIGEALQSYYTVTDPEITAIEDNDYIPLFKSSGSSKKKTKFSTIINKLKATFAPFYHADSTTNHGGATDTLYGHVKLTDVYQGVRNAKSSIAPSQKALNDAYTAVMTRADEIYTQLSNLKAPKSHASSNRTTYGAGTATMYGHVMLTDSYTGTSNANASVGASQKALNDVYNLFNGRISGDVKFKMERSFTDAPCLVGTFTSNGQTFYLMLYFQYPNNDGNRRLIVFDSDWNTIWQI